MSSKLLVNRLIYKKTITMAFFLLFSAIAVSGQEYGYHEVLWVGTSIPAGCPYPNNACRALGWDCYNVAIGASGIVVNEGLLKNDRDGKDLAETIKEKEEREKRPHAFMRRMWLLPANRKGMEMVQVAILIALAVALGIIFRTEITTFVNNTFKSLNG